MISTRLKDFLFLFLFWFFFCESCFTVSCFMTVLERLWSSEGVKTVKFYVAPRITTNKQTNKQVLVTLHFILFFTSKSSKITACIFAFFFVTLPFTFVTSNRSLISPSSPIAIVSALTWLLYHQQQQSNTYFLHSSFHSYLLPFPKIFVNCWEAFSWYIETQYCISTFRTKEHRDIVN